MAASRPAPACRRFRDLDPAGHPPRPFPDAAWERFVGSCRALGLDEADADRRAVLERLHAHLVGVNAWCNLTRIIEPGAYLERHVLDSLLPLADPALGGLPAGSRCLDLGSGAGYPGLALALWRPAWRWTLVERRRRKAAFLAAAAGLLSTAAPAVLAGDARELPSREPALAGGVDLVVARAVGGAGALVELAAPLLALGGRLLLYKGPAFAAGEADDAARRARRHHLTCDPPRQFPLAAGLAPRIVALYRREGPSS